MDSDLPTLPPPAPAPEPAPMSEQDAPMSEQDRATLAFTQLAEKVALLEAAIAGLTAKRDAMPDYSETLGEIAALLERMREVINTLAHRPAMKITPDAMAARIAEAGKTARAADSATIAKARDRIDRAASRMEHLAGTVATVREQRRHLRWVAIGGVLAGALLWSFLPGVILRAMPQGWHMPEKMATHIIGEPTLWDAGTRLLRADSPQAWNALVQASDIARDNREAIEKCHRAAAKAKKPARCTIEIRPAS